jgi:hypothetical protein
VIETGIEFITIEKVMSPPEKNVKALSHLQGYYGRKHEAAIAFFLYSQR